MEFSGGFTCFVVEFDGGGGTSCRVAKDGGFVTGV